MLLSCVWLYVSVIPSPRKQNQGDGEFKGQRRLHKTLLVLKNKILEGTRVLCTSAIRDLTRSTFLPQKQDNILVPKNQIKRNREFSTHSLVEVGLDC